MRKILGIAVGVLMVGAGGAYAGTAGELTVKALESGALEEGLSVLSPLAAGGDQEARAGLGVLTFVQTVTGLAQALYAHGLVAPDGSQLGPSMLLPVPNNPNPRPLDYAGVRDILQRFVRGMDAAKASLEAAGASGNYAIMIDPTKIRVDVDGNSRADDSESVAGLVSQAMGTAPQQFTAMPETTAPAEGAVSPAPVDGAASLASGATPVFGFDRADAYWLAGYSQVLAAQADFLLAHDFSDFVNASFHRLFPKAGFPMQDYARGGRLMLDPETDNGIADLVAALHTINWPVIDPERLKGVRQRLHSVLSLSRQNWQAILAETDDNHELVPSPKQTSQVPEGVVTQDKIDAWVKTLDTAGEILDGRLLVPHWRFTKGFDLRAYFENATRTDLVMLLTGYGALPFIKDGPVASADSFRAANEAFGEHFIGYAFWFN